MSFNEFMEDWQGLLATIVLIVTTVLSIRSYVVNTVNAKLEDPVFLEKIAKLVRPSLIFDSGESILVDQGAGKYVEKINVAFSSENFQENIPVKVTLELKKHYSNAPLLTPIQSEFTIDSERGRGNDWIFHLSQFDNYRDPADDRYQFRLELLE